MQITTVNTFDASAEHCWSIIAERFGDAAEWASSLASSSLDRDKVAVGAVRTGRIGKRVLRERVTHIDTADRVFAYDLIDPPGGIRAAANRWTVTAIGDERCRVTSELDLSLALLARPLSPLIGFGIKRQLSAAIDEFRCFAETGVPHQRKLEQQSTD